jgi:serine/threonine protein kinase/tetratricopeptide (TPR) repeat protein
MIGRTLANYRVVSQLGAGGMGVVYKAVDVRLDRSVALKVLPPGKTADADRRARFLQEARSASALNDPHIVTIHDIFVTEDGTDVLVMELIQGRTLRDVISDRPVAEGEALRLMLQVADGVGAAHAAGIVHRDLKPGNMMVTDRGLVKILDFGLAKLTAPTDEQQTMMAPNTVEGTLLGTVDYMSPEQARGEQVDHRSDIFSLGAVLYELLTGVKPFQSAHTIGVLHEILYGQIVSPRERQPAISGDAEAITLRALERDVNRRYQSMDAMASDLRAAQRALSEGHSSASRSGIAPALPPAIPSSPSSASTPSQASQPAASTPSGFPSTFPPLPAGDIASSMRSLGENLAAEGKKLGRFPRPRRVGKWGPLPVLVIVGVIAMSRPDARRWVMEQIELVRDGPITSTARDVADYAPPATAHELTQQGLALLKRFDRPGSIDRAIEFFDRAIAGEPGHAAAHAAVARAYFRKGEEVRDKAWATRAEDAARRAIQLDPYLAEGHLSLGLALMMTGGYKPARVSIDQALSLDPKLNEAWLAIGQIAEAEGRPADASRAYDTAQKLDASDWRPARLMGNLSYRAGLYREALRWYGESAKLGPDVTAPYESLGAAHHMLGDFASAAAALQKAISIAAKPGSYTNLGTALFFQGRYRESVAAFEKAVSLSATDPLMWGNLGDAYRWTNGQDAKAREAYTRASQLLRQQLTIEPGNIRNRSRHALILAKLGDAAEAKKELQGVPDLPKRDVNTLYRAAITVEVTGDRESALKWLEMALDKGYSMYEVAADPELLNLRRDIRYQRMATRYDKGVERR